MLSLLRVTSFFVGRVEQAVKEGRPMPGSGPPLLQH